MTQDDIKTIILSVNIAARPETVFRFFSDPERFRQWTSPQSGIDPGFGGALNIVFGPGPTAVGRIVEWAENERVVFTWGHGNEPGQSQVTITFEESPEGTLLTLMHSGIPGDAERLGTTSGWRHYLSTLSFAAAKDEHGAHAERLVDDYVKAWGEPDRSTRRALLASCWAADGRLLDAYANIQGVAALDAHIANAQQMMGPARLERASAIELSHGYGRFAWRVALPGGGTMMRGTNFLQFTTSGKIGIVAGFMDTPA